MVNNPKQRLKDTSILISVLSRFLRKGSITGEAEVKLITGLLNILLEIMPHPSYSVSPVVITRMTKNSSIPGVGTTRITQLKHLIFPPPTSVKKYGRCNIPGSSVLYSSFHFITNMKEMHTAVGDIVSHSKWRYKTGEAPLKVFPIFFITESSKDTHNPISLDIKIMHDNYINSLTEEEKEYMNTCMEFLAKCFAKEVDLDNHLDYLLSAHLAHKILFHPDAQYDAILYPSVQDKLGTSNLAITPTAFLSKFEPEELTHDILISIRGGGAMFDGIHHTSKFDVQTGIETGTVIWDD